MNTKRATVAILFASHVFVGVLTYFLAGQTLAHSAEPASPAGLTSASTITRSNEWQKILDPVAPEEMPQLMAWVDKMSVKAAQEGLRAALLSQWADRNPSTPIAFADKIGNPPLHDSAIVSVLRGWRHE